MEKELQELFDRHWKGLFPYEDLTREDKTRFTVKYTAQEFYNALKAAYNLAIEIAADKADTKWSPDVKVDRNSILNLQIEDE